MLKIYYDNDVDLTILKEKVIAVIGYGSQGNAQANCLKDSGLNLILGLRPEGRSWEKAKKDGFEVYSIPEAVKKSDLNLIQKLVQTKKLHPQLLKHLRIKYFHLCRHFEASSSFAQRQLNKNKSKGLHTPSSLT